MKKIKIGFTGLSIRNDFDPYNNIILDILSKHYDVEVCNDPDYLICGTLYKNWWGAGLYHQYVLSPSKVRIMFNGEVIVPDYNLVDYTVTHYPIEYYDRNLYFPFGVEAFTNGRLDALELQNRNRVFDRGFLQKKEYFACFIASHDSDHSIRGEFFKALNERKRVESAGSYLNNMPDGKTVNWLDGSKEELQKKCKFSLCFENTKHEYYISEKLIESFYYDTIPIYYGGTNVKEIFNPKSFIDISDYPSFEAAIDRILEIENNDDLYLEMMNQPIFNDPEYPEKKYAELEQFLCHIFDQPLEQAYRRSRYAVSYAHEEFMKREIESEMGIKVWRPAGKVTKEYILHTPGRIALKLLGEKRYKKLKRGRVHE
jgi:hypothetical protein